MKMTRTQTARKPKTHTFRKVSDTEYIVDSNTYTLLPYFVRYDRGNWTCTCAGYYYNFRCTHIAEIMGHIHDEAAATATAPERKERTAPAGLKLEALFPD
jgi:hypothetical protein